MNKRPKSREETPKEGSDRARPYRTATICDRAAQNARVFETFPTQSSRGWPECNRSVKFYFYVFIQLVRWTIPWEPGVTKRPQFTNLDFVNSGVTKNACLNEADPKAASPTDSPRWE